MKAYFQEYKKTSKYIKPKLTILKGEIDKFTNILGDINTLLSAKIIRRISVRKYKI